MCATQESAKKKRPSAKPAMAAPKVSNVAALFLLEYAPACPEEQSTDVLLDGAFSDLKGNHPFV